MGYYEIPRKVELINKSPLIIMLHDVVDDRYINLLTKSSNWVSYTNTCLLQYAFGLVYVYGI